jgi:hypothetical protein
MNFDYLIHADTVGHIRCAILQPGPKSKTPMRGGIEALSSQLLWIGGMLLFGLGALLIRPGPSK